MAHQATDTPELNAELRIEKYPPAAQPAPTTLGEAARLASIIGDRRARPLPHAKQYIHITTRRDFSGERFNTIPNQVTESVEIAGVKLIWNTLDRDSPLKAYHRRRDLRNLTIYADQVIFRSSFEFPRTNVTIYARELTFEDEGAIDTRPQAQIKQPSTPTDEDGIHPNYKAADGLPGEPGGSVTLYVGRIRVDGDQTRKRIQCSGSDGQNGETGRLKRYEPGKSDIRQPAAHEGKDVTPVSLKELKNRLRDLHHVPDNFHYPEYPEGHVVSAKVITFAPLFPLPNLEQFFFPGPNKLFPAKHADFSHLDVSFDWSVEHGIRPGRGRNAYPSGAPGDGGDGGAITIEHESSELDIEALCENKGGAPGVSEEVKGGPPGGPSPAYHVIMFIVRSDADSEGPYKRKPFLMKMEVTNTEWGDTQRGQTADEGARGSRSVSQSEARRWLHPLVVSGVIQYARDAFRNGYREDARDILEPYAQIMADAKGLGHELTPKRTAILAILTNLNNNLDYFGHRIGWVPRLHVTTILKLFQRERVNASRLLYFSSTLANKWDTLRHVSDAATETAGTLEGELESAQAALISAYADLEDATKRLDEIDTDLKAASRKFERVFRRATDIAIQHEEVKGLVNGMLKLAGGLARVVPIGQPYLGLAGSVVQELGNFEWTDADGALTWEQVASNFEGFGKSVGEKVDTFRTTHKDLLIKDQVKAGNKSLARRVNDATGAIRNLDDEIAKINAQIDAQWEGLRDKEIEALNARIKEVAEQIEKSKAGTPTRAELEEREASLKADRTEAATERLEAALVRLQSQLASKTETLEAKDAARKAALKEQVAALMAKRESGQANIDNLEKRQKERETRLTEAFDTMSNVGDGIASIGAGLTAMFAKVDKNDPKIQALLDNIDTSKLFDDDLRRDFHAFKDEMDEINVRKGDAVLAMLNVQQRISRTTEAISTGLADLSALGRQRTSLDGVLGLETRQYLAGMQTRSKERLHAYLYEFVKAYQYQYLNDVSDSFYNFDMWVERLRELESVNADGTVNAMPFDQFEAIEKEVIEEEYLEMARSIVEKRQQRSSVGLNTYVCTLSAEQRAALLKDGFLQFSLLDDFNTSANLSMRDARIADIVLKQLDVELAEGVTTLNLHVDFEHSGTSIILDEEGRYWFFQSGENDDPISWRYVWKSAPWLTDENGTKTNQRFDRDVRLEEDAFLDEVLSSEEIKYREYMPALFSPITLWLNKGGSEEERRERVMGIREVAFEVFFGYR